MVSISNGMICRGILFQNEGGPPKFESDAYPHDTFKFEGNTDGLVSPGMTAEIWAEVDPRAKVAKFWSEVD